MDFALTDGQVMIRDAVYDFLADKSWSEAVRAAMASEAGFDVGRLAFLSTAGWIR